MEESNNQPKLHRLHLVLTDAPKYNPRYRDHPAYPGGSAIGLLWGYALDGEEKPVWEVRPIKDGWQLQHVHGGGQHPLTSQSGDRAHRFWPLHRVHAYDAFSLHPRLNDPRHFDVAHHQRPDPLLPSPTSLFHANCSQVVSSHVSVSRCPLRVRSTARRETLWAKLEATEGKSMLGHRPFKGQFCDRGIISGHG